CGQRGRRTSKKHAAAARSLEAPSNLSVPSAVCRWAPIRHSSAFRSAGALPSTPKERVLLRKLPEVRAVAATKFNRLHRSVESCVSPEEAATRPGGDATVRTRSISGGSHLT